MWEGIRLYRQVGMTTTTRLEPDVGGTVSNGQTMLGLRQAPEETEPADRFDENRIGLDHLSFSVSSLADLKQAARFFEERDVPHGEITDLGPDFGIHILVFREPDKFQLELTAPYS